MRPGQWPKQTGQRRRRPSLACVQCRRKKIRCDRTTPCSNCVRSKGSVCSYGHLVSGVDLPPTAANEASALQGASPPMTLSRLEAPRPQGTAIPDPPTFNSLGTTATSQSTATFPNPASLASPEEWSPNIRRGNVLDDSTNQPVLPTVTSIGRAMVAKTRYFGQSHWMNTSLIVSMPLCPPKIQKAGHGHARMGF